MRRDKERLHDIDLEEVWSTVTHDLPDLKRNITSILQTMDEDEKE